MCLERKRNLYITGKQVIHYRKCSFATKRICRTPNQTDEYGIKLFSRRVQTQGHNPDTPGIPQKLPQASGDKPSLSKEGYSLRGGPPAVRGISQSRPHDANARPLQHRCQADLADYRIQSLNTPDQIRAVDTTGGRGVPHLLDWYD